MNVVFLSPLDLAIASSFIFLSALFSFLYGLDLEKRLIWAGFRTVVQLSMLGLVIKWVFQQNRALFVIVLLLLMCLIAGREAVARLKKKYRFVFWDCLLSTSVVAIIVGFIVTQMVIKIKPWYNPQYLIPLIGMILGNSLNGISISLDTFLEYLQFRKDEIELYLTFGATRQEAIRIALKDSIRKGLIPIINAMSVAGIVSLPGMMTGQILAGSPPMQAVAYQILVMFMLAGSYTLGSAIAVFGAAYRLVDPEGRLKLDKLI